MPPKDNYKLLSMRHLCMMSLLCALLTFIVLAACSLLGDYKFRFEMSGRFWEWRIWHERIWQVRVYRLLAASMIGAALATAGLALQGLMRNPLAEPYLLGISSGAGVGVLLGPTLAIAGVLPDWITVPLLAMFGAVITTAIVYLIAQRNGRLDAYVLLLSGVIVNVFNGALIMGILQFVKQTEMIHFIGWGMGHVPESLWFKPGLMVVCGLIILVGWLDLFLRAAAFNTLGLGDEVAASSGVSVYQLRFEIFIVVSFMTSAAVALAGPIGFIGLVIPHICRLIFGPDHRQLVIVCGFGGAMFLMLADTLCRMIGQAFHLGELPVGVFTALVGGPFFVLLLRWRRKGGQL